MTFGDLARAPEAEPGREVMFCPILGLPIVPALRVRTLPGFHLVSLDAGKEALARGSYQVLGQRFPCQSLEYLHPDDKVFICAEDNKAFLNEMSMRYHRYIGHELKERKAERKRLRERAEERKGRSAAHQAAQLQLKEQQQQRQVRPQTSRFEQQLTQQQTPAQSAQPPILPQQEPEPGETAGTVAAGDGPVSL